MLRGREPNSRSIFAAQGPQIKAAGSKRDKRKSPLGPLKHRRHCSRAPRGDRITLPSAHSMLLHLLTAGFGTKRTFYACRRVSVLGGKAVMQRTSMQLPILTRSRPRGLGQRSTGAKSLSYPPTDLRAPAPTWIRPIVNDLLDRHIVKHCCLAWMNRAGGTAQPLRGTARCVWVMRSLWE